jgi:hypothetical protein
MAASLLLPANGAIAFPNSLAADFGSYDLTQEQGAESVCAYGAGTDDNWRGSGTPHLMANVIGFTKGHVATSGPIGVAGGTYDADGAAATFTVDTGHTVAASCLVQSMRVSHARLRAAIPFTATLHQTGDATVTWATS